MEIQGIDEFNGEKVFILRFIQGRNPDWIQRIFFAKYDPDATWFDDLVPAFGEEKFFFTDEYNAMQGYPACRLCYIQQARLVRACCFVDR